MPGETEYEFDLAVSFAGEQRDYARGVVRGLDDNLKVFYDEDNKADMLGEDLIEAAVEAGALGYLLKDAEPDQLLDGIRAVARGESPLDPRAARRLLTRAAGSGREAAPVELSPREAEVLRLVVAGLLNKQIAQRLGITERTVKAHLTSAYQRIGVADRTQAALWAQRHDLGVAEGD